MKSLYQPNWLIRFLIPGKYRLKISDKPIVYLTFDDGPTTEYTEKILEILAFHDVKATFFCVGENARQHPELIKKIIEGGHNIGNHTMHHKNGFKTGIQNYVNEVLQASEYIPSKLFRPPYGKCNIFQNLKLRKLGYKIIQWDVIAYDWDKTRTPHDVLSIIEKYVRNGSIIVLHDSVKASDRTLPILSTLIISLKSRGFEIKTIIS
ncbi:MAG: polysaccharide deacetylase family protein [Paludibacteraceae bacterium]|nr:polysaccharide deacetylase family protein [Paludibacteraceae bacterium]